MSGFTLARLAEVAGGRLSGDPERRITGVGTLAEAGEGDITFLTNRKYRGQLETTRAGAVILQEGDRPDCPVDAIIAVNPHAAYARISALFDSVPGEGATGCHPAAIIEADADVAPTAWIGANAYIGSGARIEAGAWIGPNCVIQANSTIGAESRLAANVTVYHGCRIGRRVIVHAGVVIGSDGFGFANDAGEWIKVYQLGAVVIGDDVEIGANTTIDRGAVNDTVIEQGVKLDNLIQVAHNVRIGAHTLVAGCVGIAGSADIGAHCAIAGGAGILGHLRIAEGVTITPMSLVTKSIDEPGVYSSGTPLERSDHWQKNFVRFKQLDEMARRLKKLEKELEDLKKGKSA